jgi:GxxExxY protein
MREAHVDFAQPTLPVADTSPMNESNEPTPDLDACARDVVDAALQVHRALGPGFPESVYEQALAMELSLRKVPFKRQVSIGIHYRGAPVGQARLDLLVAGQLVVELNAAESAHPVHRVQLLSYLRATGHPVGLLINFNVGLLKDGITRVIRGQWD